MFIGKPWPKKRIVLRGPRDIADSECGDGRRKAVYLGSTVSPRTAAQRQRRTPPLKAARPAGAPRTNGSGGEQREREAR